MQLWIIVVLTGGRKMEDREKEYFDRVLESLHDLGKLVAIMRENVAELNVNENTKNPK